MYFMYRNQMLRQEEGEIVVVGSYIERVVPDMAYVSMNITTSSSEPQKASDENRKKVNQAKQQLSKFGVKPENIIIAEEVIMPVVDEEGNIIEYKAIAHFRVIFYELITMSEFFYNIRGSVATITNVFFTLKDPYNIYNNALDKSVKIAFDKAEGLAKASKVNLLYPPEHIIEITDIKDVQTEIDLSRLQEDVYKYGFLEIPASVRVKFNTESY